MKNYQKQKNKFGVDGRYLKEEKEEFVKAAYQLRYKLYCEDMGFLNKKHYKSGLEIDEYDQNSENVIVKKINKNNAISVVGTLRVVKHCDKYGFPTEKHFPELQETISGIPNNEIGEISRFCIGREFRSKFTTKLNNGFDQINIQNNKIKIYPIVLMLLFRRLYLVSKQKDIKYWLVSMEDNLFRLLAKYSLRFNPLTESYIDYYGAVRPYLAKVSDLEEVIKIKDPRLMDFFLEMDRVELQDHRSNEEFTDWAV